MKVIRVIAKSRPTGDTYIKTLEGSDIKEVYKRAVDFSQNFCHAKYEDITIEFEPLEDQSEAID